MSPESMRGLIRTMNRFLNGLVPEEGANRSKNFLSNKACILRLIVEDRYWKDRLSSFDK